MSETGICCVLQGAYYRDTHIYTPTDIREIIEFARLRGIRVMSEFDSPGKLLTYVSTSFSSAYLTEQGAA